MKQCEKFNYAPTHVGWRRWSVTSFLSPPFYFPRSHHEQQRNGIVLQFLIDGRWQLFGCEGGGEGGKPFYQTFVMGLNLLFANTSWKSTDHEWRQKGWKCWWWTVRLSLPPWNFAAAAKNVGQGSSPRRPIYSSRPIMLCQENAAGLLGECRQLKEDAALMLSSRAWFYLLEVKLLTRKSLLNKGTQIMAINLCSVAPTGILWDLV